MHFQLRTLLAILSLSAIVSAGFSVGVVTGLLAYIACLSLFMATWRVRLVCERHNLRPFAWADSWLPWEILLEAAGISLVAAAVFAISGSVILAQFAFSGPSALQFWVALGFTLPFATAAALAVFWLSWPQRSDCPPSF